jgi:ABC-type glutathione transport system ATPase component
MSGTPALEVVDLVKHFDGEGRLVGPRRRVQAVDGVSFSLESGEILGLVGESGSGKSTVAHCVVRLVQPTSGSVRLGGIDITHLTNRQLRPLRRGLHMVFQDPGSSLDPHMTCGDIVAEPLRLHRVARGHARKMRVAGVFDAVGLRQELRYRHPHELSGGERQRVSLARALVLEPGVLVADEPLSALDVSVQASILNLLRELQRGMGFSCLFITHDLSTVEFLCDRVAVMYEGKIVETAPKPDLFATPQHPCTQALLAAAVVADPRAMRARIGHAVGSEALVPSGGVLGASRGQPFPSSTAAVPVSAEPSTAGSDEPGAGQLSPQKAQACAGVQLSPETSHSYGSGSAGATLPSGGPGT